MSTKQLAEITELTIDGKVFVKKNSESRNSIPDSKQQILIADKGFVYAGNVVNEPGSKFVTIYNAVNLRHWGSKNGLGSLVNGPLKDTVMDYTGTVRFERIYAIDIHGDWDSILNPVDTKNVININGIEYVEKCAQTSKSRLELGKKQIVVGDKSFVFVGDVQMIDNGECIITNAYNIRRYGTTKGLGELTTGKTDKTELDYFGTVQLTPIIQIAVVSGW